ncbi:hypothetical protein D9M70_509110 [compost metagenome]
MLRNLSSLPWRSSSLSGCSSQPSLLCTCDVTVNWSSFSGRRLPFFSTTLPIEIRPSTGGVIAKPFNMVVLLGIKKTIRAASAARMARGDVTEEGIS